MMLQQSMPLPVSLWVRVNLHPWIYTTVKIYNCQKWTANCTIYFCDSSMIKWKANSVWLGRLTGMRVNLSPTNMTQHTFCALQFMLSSCLTQIYKALLYSSAAADCCCSKAVYWPRPTLMLHPSNAAAAWPTFFACHTVATVPVNGIQAPMTKKWLEGSYTRAANSKCSINSNSQK